MKKVIICLFTFVLVFMAIGCNNNETNIADNKELYDIAIQYVIDNDTNPEKNNDRYKMFVDYNGFGITKDDHYRYAYMWISEGSFYIADNKIIVSAGSSVPYKFTFGLNDNEIIKYDIPKDGSEYESSIKEMFPDDIVNKAFDYQWKDDELIKRVRDYYSDLEDKNLYYYLGDKDGSGEYIKLDK